MIKKITGKTNWYDNPDTTLAALNTNLAALNTKMDPTTGHKHTGVAGDGPLLPIRLIDYKEYTSSGTWTKPAGAQFILVQCIGGGAGGGTDGEGGGGGGNCMRFLRADIVPSSVSVTVGSGGSPGSNGGNSIFGNATGIYIVGYGGRIPYGGGAGTNNTGTPAWGNLGGATSGASEYGGGGGGIIPGGYLPPSPGGSSLWGGGGGGGGSKVGENSQLVPGAPGGSSGHGAVAGGSAGKNGANGIGMFAGGGGGGADTSGRAGNGGFPGGGGGGKRIQTPLSDAGRGGSGVVRVWVW